MLALWKLGSEEKLRLITAGVLWTISASLSIGLFLALAGEQILRKIIMILLALALESAKVLTFRLGKSYRIISLTLISLSVLASFGAGLLTIEENSQLRKGKAQVELEKSINFQAKVKEIESLDQQISVITERLQKIPGDYTTAFREATAHIQVLRDRRTAVGQELSLLEVSREQEVKAISMFALIARMLHVKVETVLLVVLLVLAIVLEITIMALSVGHSVHKDQKESKMSYGLEVCRTEQTNVSYPKLDTLDDVPQEMEMEAPETVEITMDEDYPTEMVPVCPTASYASTEGKFSADDFFKAMQTGMSFPNLRGRDQTAQQVGVTPYQAKQFVKELIQTGRIHVVGKRLQEKELSYSRAS